MIGTGHNENIVRMPIPCYMYVVQQGTYLRRLILLILKCIYYCLQNNQEHYLHCWSLQHMHAWISIVQTTIVAQMVDKNVCYNYFHCMSLIVGRCGVVKFPFPCANSSYSDGRGEPASCEISVELSLYLLRQLSTSLLVSSLGVIELLCLRWSPSTVAGFRGVSSCSAGRGHAATHSEDIVQSHVQPLSFHHYYCAYK